MKKRAKRLNNDGILDLIANRPELTVPEIAKLLSVSKPTVYILMRKLKAAGKLSQQWVVKRKVKRRLCIIKMKGGQGRLGREAVRSFLQQQEGVHPRLNLVKEAWVLMGGGDEKSPLRTHDSDVALILEPLTEQGFEIFHFIHGLSTVEGVVHVQTVELHDLNTIGAWQKKITV